MKNNFYKDALICRTTINFSLWHRIRILFGAPVELTTRTDTENEIGACSKTESNVFIPRLFNFRRQAGAAEISSNEQSRSN